MEDRKIRLLLIEDDKVDQMAFERSVKKNDLPYDYSIAGSIAEARKITKSINFDVIISDYMLGDGVSFELFELYKELPVIVTTGTGNEEVAVEAMKLGAYDYLIKDPEGHYLKTLPATVELALKRKQNEKKLQRYQKNLESMVKERTAKLQAEIIEHRRTEEALRESEKRFRDITHSMADWIWEVDKNGKYTYVSDTVKNILGYSSEELIGKTPFELMPMKEKAKISEIFFETVSKARPIIDLENWNLAKDGTEVCLLTNGVPIIDVDGKLQGYRGVDKDITVGKQAEAEKKMLESQLRQLQKNEAIGALAGGIAHDFNNILFPIVGFAEMLKADLPKNSDLHENIDVILTGAMRAKDLIQQILTFSRQSEQDIKPLKPHLVIKEVAKLVSSTIPTSIEIKDFIDPKTQTIIADPTQIHQVAMNLITNAYHAMQNSGGVLTIRLQNIEKADIPKHNLRLGNGPHVLLSIEDTGTGMDTITLEKIFDPYFTTKPKEKGTGLGLSVVHGIVKNYGGDISVNSSLGQGTIFDVYVPAFKKEVEPEQPHDPQLIPKGNERVLLVDDEAQVLRTEQMILERLGYKVDPRNSSLDALETIKANPDSYDLVISDMTMPNMTGDQLAQKILDIKPTLPIIICTGFSERISLEKVKYIGVKALLMKPIIKSKLASTIRKVLDKAKKEAEDNR